ncbi:MAG: DNA-processing protein DprA [Ghiorsea sp.]|nr:DNA-processing protein DprA [Ghiorsea sp.]
MISSAVEDYLRLSFTAGVGVVTARQLIEVCGSARAVWQQSKQDWLAVDGVGPKLVNALGKANSEQVYTQIQTIVQQCEQENIHLLCPEDDAWSCQLERCADAPILLYAKGELSCLNASHTLGMVGARKASAEGKLITRRWASYVSKQGVVVVSGMAPGIDSAAHGGSLDAESAGIAVLGYGLMAGSPLQNKQIEALAEKGCVVSEYAPDQVAHPSFFPQRNRLIAGLSQALLVVEGGLKSGSLITARQALAYGREVFAVPGSVLNDVHAGCHHLIKDGAILATDAQDILQNMGWLDAGVAGEKYQPASVTEAKIIALLQVEIKHVDALAEDCGLTVPVLSTILLALELGGIIEKLPGSRYTLV